uniref:C2H2-type domain-containing protein n=1 Tax=Neogobius melanostomus TaxID=47308 RepID=A0A8C6TSI7_9GOBI
MDEEASAINLRGQFRCDECGLNLNSERGVRKHSALHFTSRPFVCDQCGWRFSVSNTLKIHQATHQEDKPFQCDECSQRFALKMRLMDHKLKHSKIMPHVCAECGEGFNRPCKLKEHQLKKHFRIYEGKQRPDRGERGEREEKKSEGKLLLNLQQLRMESDHRGGEGHSDEERFSSFHLREHKKVHHKESRADKEVHDSNESPNLQKIHEDDCQNQEINNKKVYRCDKCGRDHRLNQPHACRQHRHGERRSGDPSAKSRRCFTCRECEVQLQLDRTALVNVFSVTNFAHVRCFVDSHTLI